MQASGADYVLLQLLLYSWSEQRCLEAAWVLRGGEGSGAILPGRVTGAGSGGEGESSNGQRISAAPPEPPVGDLELSGEELWPPGVGPVGFRRPRKPQV